ncbi:hypothetical protein GXW82_01265 [Streptacidiphilus sp. 4-A2]|nr:hypothetical protein [Streptacidiphilus sp. 4-A2]
MIADLALSPDGAHIYTADNINVGAPGGGTGAVSVIDTATDTVTSTIPLRGTVTGVSSVVFSPNGKLAYVSVAYSSGKHADYEIQVVRTATAKVTTTIERGSPGILSATFLGNGARAYVGPLRDASGRLCTGVVPPPACRSRRFPRRPSHP